MYQVFIGSYEVLGARFETKKEAMAECWQEAIDMAAEEGHGPDEDYLEEYEENDGTRCGVCPSNNDGAFWPCVRQVE